MAGKRDIDSLPFRAEKGAKAVGELTDAFAELSRTGTVSNKSLTQVAGTLESLGPAGKIAGLGLGTIIGMFDEVSKAGDKLINGAFRDFGRSLEMQAEFEAKASAAGGVLATKYRELGQITSGLAKEEDKRADVLKDTEEKVRTNLSLFRVITHGMAATRAETLGLAEATKEAIVTSTGHTQSMLRRQAVVTEEIRRIEAAAKAWDNFGRQSKLAQSINAALFSQGIGLEDRLTVKVRAAISLTEERINLLRQQAAVEAQTSGSAQASTIEEIAVQQRLLDQLRQQIDMQQRLGAMAESAIGGAAAGAFDAYADALDRTVSLNNLASRSMDRTLRNIAASTIRNIGRQAAVEGGMEAARALAALAVRDFDGAANHAAASAAFFGVAAAAGVGAGLVSVKPGGRGDRRDRGADSSGGRGGPTVNLVVIGAPDFTTKQTIAGWVAEMAEEGAV